MLLTRRVVDIQAAGSTAALYDSAIARPMTTPYTDTNPRTLRNVLATSAIALLGVAMSWFLIWTELQLRPMKVSWSVFVIISALLLVCERSPRTWIRFGPIGVVTPLWLFAYALILLGSPSAGVGVALVGATMNAMLQVDSVSGVVRRVGGTAISLATAGLILLAMGVHGSIAQDETVPWDWGLAIVLAGMAIVGLNAAVAAISMSIRRRMSLIALLRRGLAVRLTAEGALISLAPIWVIGIDFSLVLAPLLGITTILVFRSTRQALERAHEAHHDALTGLLNRRAFLDYLHDALVDPRPDAQPQVLLMDLDGFKEINDRLGHEIGDALLVAFADRLETSLPPETAVARLGGDEFAVLIQSSTDPGEIANQLAQLHAALAAPLDIEGFPVTIGVSIGVASAPDDGRTKTDLLRAADVAMYRAKRRGSAIEHYDNCVKTPQHGRLSLLSELSDALSDHQLHIHFQPQLRLADGSVDTVEALIRWQHPEHGAIPPGDFIGVAEQTDLIGPITDLVLRAATTGMIRAGADDIKLAVNVSARTLQDSAFADQVFAILGRSGFPPDRLELEVTERAIVTNVERSSYTISRLRQAGVRIAIDDFGVGYSSYQTLRMLEVDRVKIDRDFVTNLTTDRRDRLIVASLINLAHELGLDVVAEGVESALVWDALCALKCDVAQGFGIAMPMAFPDLRGWLGRWNEVTLDGDLVAAN
jgi:diguanylate cyclase